MNVLVTGGAGFIGSNLVGALLKDKRVARVRALDNLATGHLRNLEEFKDNPNFEFLEGDIRDFSVCAAACDGMNRVAHQAALGSVPRSIDDPLQTNAVNITGTLNVFRAAYESGIDRVVFAASSSTYGDSRELPKIESRIGKPLSPYAVTKLVNELYADVFQRTYGLDFVGLRYFNVFGPKQDPNGAYAAVIPLFAKALLTGVSATINGDGEHSRDFTYIDNVTQANIKGLFLEDKEGLNEIYNVACGQRISLLELFNYLQKAVGVTAEPILGPERQGDVRHSLADISKARNLLGYEPIISVEEGIQRSMSWYQKLFSK